MSALFALADEQFSGVRVAAEALQEEYSESLRGGELDVPLDATSLVVYVNESPRVAAVARLFEDCGTIVQTEPSTTWPDRRQRDRSDLIAALTRRGISTLAELDDLLVHVLERVETICRYVQLYQERDEDDAPLEAFIEDLLTMAAFIVWRSPSKEIARVYQRDQTLAVLRMVIEAEGQSQSE